MVVRRLAGRASFNRWLSLAGKVGETGGPAAVVRHRWLNVAQALIARLGAPAGASKPGLWPPRWRLDLPFLASWAWLPWRLTTAPAGLEGAAGMPGGGRPAGRATLKDGPLAGGGEAAITEAPAAAAVRRRSSPAPMTSYAAADLSQNPVHLAAADISTARRQDMPLPAASRLTASSADTGRAPSLIRTVAERTPYTAPDERLRQFLSGILRLPLPAVRLHAGPAADAALGALRADAVAYGADILLREGALQGDRRRGLALVAHEMAHAALAEGGPQQGSAPFVGSEPEEERLAQAGERHVLHVLTRTPALPSLEMPTLAAASGLAPAVPPTAVRTAPAGRDVAGLPPETPPPAAALTEQQLRIIKDAVYRDLMNRLRLEHERGG